MIRTQTAAHRAASTRASRPVSLLTDIAVVALLTPISGIAAGCAYVEPGWPLAWAVAVLGLGLLAAWFRTFRR